MPRAKPGRKSCKPQIPCPWGCTHTLVGDLDRHRNDVHERIKPYKCPYEGCEHATAQKAALNLHITAIHEDGPTYKCPQFFVDQKGVVTECDKEYRSKSALCRHRKTNHGWEAGSPAELALVPTPVVRKGKRMVMVQRVVMAKRSRNGSVSSSPDDFPSDGEESDQDVSSSTRGSSTQTMAEQEDFDVPSMGLTSLPAQSQPQYRDFYEASKFTGSASSVDQRSYFSQFDSVQVPDMRLDFASSQVLDTYAAGMQQSMSSSAPAGYSFNRTSTYGRPVRFHPYYRGAINTNPLILPGTAFPPPAMQYSYEQQRFLAAALGRVPPYVSPPRAGGSSIPQPGADYYGDDSWMADGAMNANQQFYGA
ncbi:hypothetical protein C8Q76DRAFT_858457 [Earliella scabrosa]|nr:hypothetical protein C8Q76DRAFT_858457 [Earliella scabrosa]